MKIKTIGRGGECDIVLDHVSVSRNHASIHVTEEGNNSIGRDVSQAIALDHGDSRISRENHCTVTYDPVSRKFYLQPGAGKNLTYLESQPVLALTQLAAGNQIRVGDTELRFVPLCGKDFDWTET